MNKLLAKLPAALAISGALAVGAPSVANANVMASAVLETSNFLVRNAADTATLDASAFSFLTFTNSGGYAGTLVGTPGYNASGSTTGLDLPVACVGSGCGAFNAAYGVNNSFTHLIPPPVGNYSAADQKEAGAPITGIPGLAAPASVANGSYAGLTSVNGLSHSTSTNNLNASLIFTPVAAGAVRFKFTAAAYLQTYVTANENFPAFATASYTLDFTLVDLSLGGAVVSTIAPDVFGNGVNSISLNAPLPIDINQVQNGSVDVNFLTPVLLTGHLYQLSARNNVNADAQRQIPEPESLLLMGIGLLGLALGRKKRVS